MSPLKSVFNLPGPRGSPLLNLLKFAKDPLPYVTGLFRDYGSLAALSAQGGTSLFSTHADCPGTVFVYGPELTRLVESQADLYYKCALSGPLYPNAPVSPRQAALLEFGTGLFDMNGEAHRQHRRLIMPAFHKNNLDGYLLDIVKVTRASLATWQPGQFIDLQAEMRRLTLRIAATTLFGEESDEIDGLGRALQAALKLIVSPATHLLPFDLPGFHYRHLIDAANTLSLGLRRIISLKCSRGTLGDDVLSTLLQARVEGGVPLSESEIVGHAGAILAAGYETSSTALTWTLFLLSQHPHFTAELLSQIVEHLQGGSPALSQLNQIPLLDYTIKESLRLFPPVIWNTRVARCETTLAGFTIPAGTEIFVSIYHTHRQPDLYEAPDTFNPKRWASLQRDGFEYNPFGGGAHLCLGASFALQEMKVVLAMLLQRYRIQFMPGTAVDRFLSITMSPKAGLPMRVHEQDGHFERGVGGVRGNVCEMVRLPAEDWAANLAEQANIR